MNIRHLVIPKSETNKRMEEALKKLDSCDDIAIMLAIKTLSNFRVHQYRLNEKLLLEYRSKGVPNQKIVAMMLIELFC